MRTKVVMMTALTLFLSAPALADINRTDIDISGYRHLGPEDAPVTLIEFLDFQ